MSPTERLACPVCGAPVGLIGGLVGHHVAHQGDTVWIEGVVEMEPECVQTHNSATPGLLITRETDRTGDKWRLVHAPSGLIIHRAGEYFTFDTACRLAEKLGTVGDWLNDNVRDDDELAVNTLVLIHLARLGQLDQ